MSRTATPADVLSGAARSCVVEGDATDVVRALPLACLDALVTDPPAGVSFMNATWDHHKGGRAQWVAWLAEVLGHARAATRDGGRALVWSLPRTSHWTGCAVEDAGWSIETTVTHLQGQGWPKGKSQLKPLAETWWLARTGRSTALGIEACRVGTSKRVPGSLSVSQLNGYGVANRRGQSLDDSGHNPNVGRYPPNAVFSHAPGCRCVGDAWECVDENCPVAELDRQSGDLQSGADCRVNASAKGTQGNAYGVRSREAGAECVTYGDRGGASRFFPCFPADEYALFGYHAKPSRAERDAGVDGGNVHSTVKSIALMRWLIRLVTQPGDVVLDPFGGSGTTGAAALAEGRRVILVERDPRFAEIARQRLEHVTPDMGRPVRVAPSARAGESGADPRQPGLFDAAGAL